LSAAAKKYAALAPFLMVRLLIPFNCQNLQKETQVITIPGNNLR
jgi:hypothetical protein